MLHIVYGVCFNINVINMSVCVSVYKRRIARYVHLYIEIHAHIFHINYSTLKVEFNRQFLKAFRSSSAAAKRLSFIIPTKIEIAACFSCFEPIAIVLVYYMYTYSKYTTWPWLFVLFGSFLLCVLFGVVNLFCFPLKVIFCGSSMSCENKFFSMRSSHNFLSNIFNWQLFIVWFFCKSFLTYFKFYCYPLSEQI